jgi:hypothetical protein
MSPTTRRAIPTAVLLGIAMAAVIVAPSGAATRGFTVLPEAVAPGDVVTVRIDDSGPWHGTDLYLIPASAWFEGMHCDGMRAAVLVGTITWTKNLGVAEFTMPSVPDGTYGLGEELGAVIPPCNQAGAVTVLASRGPDTAVGRGPLWIGPSTVLALVFLLATTALATLTVIRSRRRERTP